MSQVLVRVRVSIHRTQSSVCYYWINTDRRRCTLYMYMMYVHRIGSVETTNMYYIHTHTHVHVHVLHVVQASVIKFNWKTNTNTDTHAQKNKEQHTWNTKSRMHKISREIRWSYSTMRDVEVGSCVEHSIHSSTCTMTVPIPCTSTFTILY